MPVHDAPEFYGRGPPVCHRPSVVQHNLAVCRQLTMPPHSLFHVLPNQIKAQALKRVFKPNQIGSGTNPNG